MIIRLTRQDVEGVEHVEGRIYITVDTPMYGWPRIWMGPESFQALRDVVDQDGEAWCEVPEEQMQREDRKAAPPEPEDSEGEEDLDESDTFQCWCGWRRDEAHRYTHDEYADNVELQFGERGLPMHEPSENWNLPEPEISTSNVAEWLTAPDGALVVLRRHVAGAGREQWAVVPDGDQVAVMWAATGTWAPAGAFPTVEDAIAGTTALREVHRETASFYDLAPGLNEHEFAALLDPCGAEGSDDPDEWPDEELDACEWEELDIWSRADEFTFYRRVARVGDWDLAWIDDDGVHVPVLADEDGFRALAEIASTKVATYLLVTSMVAGDGGNDLVLIAPGVACNVPTGDEAEYGETGYFLVGYPDDGTPDQQAAAIAGWLDDIKFTFWAAMLLEPLDPGSTIPAEDREAWDEFDSYKRAAYLEVPDGIEPLLPSELTEISGMYERIAEARRNPAGEVGRGLIASNYSELFFSGLW